MTTSQTSRVHTQRRPTGAREKSAPRPIPVAPSGRRTPVTTRSPRRQDPQIAEYREILQCCRVREAQYRTHDYLAAVRPEDWEVYVFVTVGDVGEDARGHFAAGQTISRCGVGGTIMTGVVTQDALLAVFPLLRLREALEATLQGVGERPLARAA
jgi:hypothetical protein